MNFLGICLSHISRSYLKYSGSLSTAKLVSSIEFLKNKIFVFFHFWPRTGKKVGTQMKSRALINIRSKKSVKIEVLHTKTRNYRFQLFSTFNLQLSTFFNPKKQSWSWSWTFNFFQLSTFFNFQLQLLELCWELYLAAWEI